MPTYFEKLILNENQEPVYEVYLNGKLDRTETPEQRGLWKSHEFVILHQRVALNPLTMKNVSAIFLQRLVYKTPNREGYDYHYFYYSKDVSLPHVKALDPRLGRFCGFCSAVITTDSTFVKKIGAPKRLSREQVQKILKTREYEGIPYLGIFGEEDGSEGVAAKAV